jgi:diaminohydroxyphosphoribosylaminopyrimidine deaminase / 5-amino-6-(5-phosphoribosylamino)uracil reductase
MAAETLLKPGYSSVGWLPEFIPNLALSQPLALGADEKLMHLAILESMQALSRARPNPGVGCAVDLNNTVIAAGSTEEYRARHAERVASDLLGGCFPNGSTIATTLEPCAQHGNQPPCLDLFQKDLAARVLIGFVDPDQRTRGTSIQALRQRGLDVQVGVLGKECAAMQLPFIAQMTQRSPLIALKWAESADRHLFHPDDTETRFRITGPEADVFSHRLRQRYDAIVVGAATWIKDRPQLTARHALLPGCRQPVRVIIDPRNQLKELPDLRERFDSLSGDWVVLTPNPSLCPTFSANVRFVKLTGPLESDTLMRGIERACLEIGARAQSILIEGGPRLLEVFLKEHRYDVVHRLRSKRVFAGKSAPFPLEVSRGVCLGSMDLGEDLLDEFISPEMWLKVEELQSLR